MKETIGKLLDAGEFSIALGCLAFGFKEIIQYAFDSTLGINPALDQLILGIVLVTASYAIRAKIYAKTASNNH